MESRICKHCDDVIHRYRADGEWYHGKTGFSFCMNNRAEPKEPTLKESLESVEEVKEVWDTGFNEFVVELKPDIQTVYWFILWCDEHDYKIVYIFLNNTTLGCVCKRESK